MSVNDSIAPQPTLHVGAYGEGIAIEFGIFICTISWKAIVSFLLGCSVKDREVQLKVMAVTAGGPKLTRH